MKVFCFIVFLMFAVVTLAMPGSSFAGVCVSVNIAPPPLPVYEQPVPPGPSYIWTPGYWAYDSFEEDYYWVPGTWVMAPAVGVLWTPGYWCWRDRYYVWNEGYWGPHVGFYGGINYGFGYGGCGFFGGGWHDGVFINRTVNVNKTVNVTNVTNVTNNTYNTTNNTASFNGGVGGTIAKPTPVEQIAAKEKHIPPTVVQKFHVQAASKNRALLASVNHGKPAIAATPKPGVFKGKGVVAAKRPGTSNFVAAKNKQRKPSKTPFAVEPKSIREYHGQGIRTTPAARPKPSREFRGQDMRKIN